jgi:hypothetical protein
MSSEHSATPVNACEMPAMSAANVAEELMAEKHMNAVGSLAIRQRSFIQTLQSFGGVARDLDGALPPRPHTSPVCQPFSSFHGAFFDNVHSPFMTTATTQLNPLHRGLWDFLLLSYRMSTWNAKRHMKVVAYRGRWTGRKTRSLQNCIASARRSDLSRASANCPARFF